VLEDTIRQRSEQQKKAGVELDATCHICLKTKFADGVGHICNYCNIRCCARCGGKVTLRSNKVSQNKSCLNWNVVNTLPYLSVIVDGIERRLDNNVKVLNLKKKLAKM